MSRSTNYLESVAGMQPRLPVDSEAKARSVLPIEESSPGPLQSDGPASARHPAHHHPRQDRGEEVSPELLADLHRYIEETVSATVTEGIKTLIPEVIELTLAQSRTSHPASEVPPGSVSAPPMAPRPATLVPQATGETRVYETPVPTMHTTPAPYSKAAPLSLAAAWASVFGIVVVMAGVVAYTMSQTPQASTERVVNEQSHQIEQKDQLIEDLAKEAARAKECRAFCF